MKFYKLLALLSVGVAGAFPTACTDKYEDMENHMPSWLNSNIYDYLSGRGDCTYYIRLIDDCGYTDAMKVSGSNTLFFSNDASFERFFQTNEMGYRSYEDLPYSFKMMLLKLGTIPYSQLLERLSLSDRGQVTFRRTTDFEVEDTIPVVDAEDLPDSKYFAPYRRAGKPIKLLSDATKWTLVQFFPDVMSGKHITDDDFSFVTGIPREADDASLFANKIIQKDIVCQNGYLHELADVLVPPENMAAYIRGNEKVSRFSRLMDRFACPVFYKRDAQGDSIFQTRYFNQSPAYSFTEYNGTNAPGLLYFDPGWNLYQPKGGNTSQPGYETDMGCMFVPTNEAMDRFFSPSGEGSDFFEAFGSWDKVPDNIAADFVANHQKYSFLSSLPSRFGDIKDEAGYEMEVSKENIVDKFVGRNGVVYVTDKVFTPLDYRTVMGPAKIDSLNSIFNQAMTDAQFVYYLRSLKSTYQFFVTPNEYMKDYVDPVAKSYASENYRCNLEFQLTPQNTVAAVPTRTSDGTVITDNNFPLGYNGTVSNSSILKNRLEDILNCQTLVTESNEAFEAARAGGQEYFITKGYAPVRITQDNKISGAGNERPLTVSKIYNKENGNTYLIDGILQNTTTSIYDVLSSKDDFREFYDMCALLGIFVNNPTSSTVAPGRKVKFLNQYHYTVYVPTNEAIREAQAKGWIPTVGQIENEGDQSVRDSLENVMERFVRYHFQDNSVFIKGEKVESKAYLTSTINEASNKFYPVYVTNKDGNITLVDEADYGTGRVSARVVKTEGVYNLMTRDMTLNSGDKEKATTIEAYTYAVIHQIDDVLWFEQPKGENAKDQE